ncbi:hypothetical protein EDD17DRAFT_1853299 [Pisolithus thermaeus]|nr:hypothetical protein EV401DRAFT_1862540 [Pisolithus croceorrhizus]KAI6150187.1 hypothetical protein EDD17DRAFT_1853299 [Pisolithus thermaeus]
MVRKGSKQDARPAPPKREDERIGFPPVFPKNDLFPRVTLEDQIITIDGFLSAGECKQLVRFIDGLPLELTPPKKKGEAERVNYRLSLFSPSFAEKLHSLLLPHLPSFPYPASTRKRLTAVNNCRSRLPHSCNSNIRIYKYTPLQHLGAHYDESVKDMHTGAKSEWTLLIYLTGVEDGVKGGETVFYNDKGKLRETIVAPLTRGTALLHRHGNECLLHEGTLVQEGTKYVLRSDLMFLD